MALTDFGPRSYPSHAGHTKKSHCFLSPFQHEGVSTIEAKNPRDVWIFFDKKAKIHLRNKPKLCSKVPNTMPIWKANIWLVWCEYTAKIVQDWKHIIAQ